MSEFEQVTSVQADTAEGVDLAVKLCEPCLETEENKHAVQYCKECDEYMCVDCLKRHRTTKITKSHSPISIEEKMMQDLIKCDPCFADNKAIEASYFCKICEEYLCDSCKTAHNRFKASKTHEVVTREEAKNDPKMSDSFLCLCDPCKDGGSEKPAKHYCSECKEFICNECVKSHKILRVTRDHKIVSAEDHIASKQETVTYKCGPCKVLGTEKNSQLYCNECDECLCEDCARLHGVQKSTKNHKLVEPKPDKDNKEPVYIDCEPCKGLNKSTRAAFYCLQCEENYCFDCKELHSAQKLSRNHELRDAVEFYSENRRLCDTCKLMNKTPQAGLFYCNECEEYLCIDCKLRHGVSKYSKDHTYRSADEAYQSSNDVKVKCEPCNAMGTESIAIALCIDCDNEALCGTCLEMHNAQKVTKNHRASSDLHLNRQQTKLEQTSETQRTQSSYDSIGENATKKQDTPGQPLAHDITSDSITISWERPTVFEEEDHYQLSVKEISKGKWKIINEEYDKSTVVLNDIKANTAYKFRVRVVKSEGEGPYSPESDEFVTLVSPAHKLIEFCQIKEEGNPTPNIYAIPLTELKEARNKTAKTRKMEIGSPDAKRYTSNIEKTIMLIGATGTGKSTLVDGFVNFVMGVNWNDPFRFKVVDLEEEEKSREKNQALSQTEWITTYIIRPEPGGRLKYQLNIIDTPGFGDTRGLQRDQEIVDQIRELFSATDRKGVALIDAVCFLAKAPDARLTAVQTYIFQSVMSLFGKDIEDNICSLITFADGIQPPVLAALQESHLPFGKTFTFNNSGLFARNDQAESLSPMFWEMGVKSFKNFFTHLDTVQTKSLKLTKNVLDDRLRLEMTVRNLQPKLDIGLTKVNQLKQEIKIFQDHKSEIERNKDFEYEVTETRQNKEELPKGRHVTNCTHCHFTCHENCVFANDDEKKRCCAMDGDGNCKICPDKCFWQKHANTPYIFTYVDVKVKKTYAEKMQKYKDAEGKLPNQEQLLEKMGLELDELIDVIEDMMSVVKDCNERLAAMALRPNPLSMTEHIDMMIQAEELDKKEGFMERIKVLKQFRQRAELTKHAENFSKEAQSTLWAAGAVSAKQREPKDTKSLFARIKKLFF